MIRAALLAFLLTGCSSPIPTPQRTVTAEVVDESRYFPLADQTATTTVPDRLLDEALPPGGTRVLYHDAKGTYEMNLVHLASAEKAAFLLLDIRKILEKPQYLAHMGGYYGLRKGTSEYYFAKGPFIACIKGLPQDRADALARRFAGKLP